MLLLVLVVGILGGAIGSAAGGSSALVLRGDTRAVSTALNANAGSGVLSLRAANDINLMAQHIRVVGRDGNFEFEHGTSTAASTLSSYVAGTSTRTPIRIGHSNQDVLSLLVDGLPKQTSDLQEWSTGGTSLLAVDSLGRLRFGTITLWAASRKGRIVTYAQAPHGKPQVLSSTAG